jgi:hypothetical protein
MLRVFVSVWCAVACCVWRACRGTLARQANGLRPESDELDMLRLLHLLRDVACGLKLLAAQKIVHADLVRCFSTCVCVWSSLHIHLYICLYTHALI